MRTALLILFLLLVLIGAAAVIPLFMQDAGLVSIRIFDWVVETTVVFFAGMVVIGFLALWFLVRLFEAPRRLGERLARHGLENGLMALAEGDWRKAERTLTRAARHLDSPAGYLAAARSAQGENAEQRREEYLLAAAEGGRRSQRLVALTRARVLMSEERWAAAAKILLPLHDQQPRHQQTLRMLLQCYRANGDWQAAMALLPALRKRKLVDDEQAAHITALALEQLGHRDDAKLPARWQALPRPMQQRPQVLAAYARAARNQGHPEWAEPVLAKALRKTWSDQLVTAYGEVAGHQPKQALAQCERWHKAHPEDATLLRLMGRLCRAQGLWGKAREYLERSLQIAPSSEGYRLLGDYLTERGENDQALICYRNALRLERDELPQPLAPATQHPVLNTVTDQSEQAVAPRDYA
ncbi:MAG: heme biosynthesis protein HemY [Wenzhouxiangellaceae bacterium]